MITGAHFLFYSTDADADRAFFRDVLGWRHVDAGHGWLIFALPPGEAAVHPADESLTIREGGHVMAGAVLYLMCDDLDATLVALAAKKVRTAPVEQARWGRRTTVGLPSGGAIGLYQPSHPTAI